MASRLSTPLLPRQQDGVDIVDQEQNAATPTGRDLLALEPRVLHAFVASKLETALGHELPQLEIRFHNLSLRVDKDVSEVKRSASDAPELPTVGHSIETAARQFLSAFPSHKPKKTAQRHILQDVTGVFRPGTLTLVLGQPGSGKSSLLKVLSGQFPMTTSVHVSGEVTYNGVSREDPKLYSRLPQFASYITQGDTHFPSLTVRETLEFASHCCNPELALSTGKTLLSHGSPEENAEAVATAQALATASTDVIIEQLGLHPCQNTAIGDELHRGVSGGERKRVTTGEMQFGMKYATFMDEISTGLDSAATFDIVRTQRSIARKLHRTVVIALLQPTPEVFELFDDVLLLHAGRVLYHGPTERALKYFETHGFLCPHDRDAADFLVEIGPRADQQKQPQEPGGGGAMALADVFERSLTFAEMKQRLVTPVAPALLDHVAKHMEPMPAFREGFWTSTWELTKRQLIVASRNKSFVRVRAFMVVIMGLIYSSTFYDFDPTNAQVVLGVLFQATMFLALGQASQIPAFLTARAIYYKQRRANFYRTSSFVLASSIALAPQAAIETLVFGSLVYWLCGFIPTAAGYILFLFLMLATNLVFCAWFFLLTAICPTFNVAKPMSTFSIVFFQVFAGFVVPRGQLPPYLVWLYWFNPVSWCVRALAVQQYRSSRYDICKYGNVDYCSEFGMTMGEYSLAQFDVPAGRNWIWGGVMFVLLGYAVIMATACFILEHKRYDSPSGNSAVASAMPVDDDDDKKARSMEGDYTIVKTPRAADTTIDMPSPDTAKLFTPITLAFNDLWYSVPTPHATRARRHGSDRIDLLKGVSGFAVPGTMTALMGSSGAGKTTLMDVIAGRKQTSNGGGHISGQILLNGSPATELAVRRCTGYCEQLDIHSDASTIREAILFSAMLRQDSTVSTTDKRATVDECLDLLDLTLVADRIIRGCSQEQRKRLTIGVELAAQPSVLFLDEPTSGLDARAAKVIMKGVRKVANRGRTIVCTIHQPAADVFALFDRVLLLRRGGETVFFGDRNLLVPYFEALPGVAPLPDGQNPATWMLEVIGAGVTSKKKSTHELPSQSQSHHGHHHSSGASTGLVSPSASASSTDNEEDENDQHPLIDVDFAASFRASQECVGMLSTLAQPGFTIPIASGSEVVFVSKRAAASTMQMRALMTRFFDMYWRTPSYNLTRWILAMALGFVFGLTALSADYTTYQGLNSGIGLIFMTTIYNGIVSYTGILPFAARERASFYRERASQTYNALWYWLGSTLAEIPYVLVTGMLFCVFFYPIAGFGTTSGAFSASGLGNFFFYWLNTSLFVLGQTYVGQLLAFALPSVEVAAVVGTVFNTVCLLFAGFNPPADSIPAGYQWLFTITPHRYSLSVLVTLVFANCPDDGSSDAIGCQNLQDAPVKLGDVTVQEYIESVFQMRRDDMMHNFGCVFIFLAVYRALAILALRYINHQKR